MVCKSLRPQSGYYALWPALWMAMLLMLTGLLASFGGDSRWLKGFAVRASEDDTWGTCGHGRAKITPSERAAIIGTLGGRIYSDRRAINLNATERKCCSWKAILEWTWRQQSNGKSSNLWRLLSLGFLCGSEERDRWTRGFREEIIKLKVIWE